MQGHLYRPFWGLVGAWAVFCGALASGRLSWDAQDLIALTLVLLLTELGWGSLWDLLAGLNWCEILHSSWFEAKPARLPLLPYMQPRSPGGRLQRALARLAGWWGRVFWPANAPVILGGLGAAALSASLALVLPVRLLPLHLVLWTFVGVGIIWRCRGRAWLAGQSFSQASLGWLAGYAAFAPWDGYDLILALSFGLAVWGALRLAARMPGSVLLLAAGQAVAASVLIVLRHPLAAGLVGGMIAAQIALYPVLRQGAESRVVARRQWPWLMAAMLVVAVALL